MALANGKKLSNDPPAKAEDGKMHKRVQWGDRKLGDNTAALRYRDPDNFPSEDWRAHAAGNFPNENEIPPLTERVMGEKYLRSR